MPGSPRDCVALIKHINVKMTREANKRLNACGVTFMQVHALLVLQNTAADAVPLKSLEKHFEVAQSTAAGIIVRLEKKGLVDSFVPANDKRLKYVRLTEKGHRICNAMKADMREGEETLLSPLNTMEREQLYDLLSKVNNTLK